MILRGGQRITQIKRNSAQVPLLKTMINLNYIYKDSVHTAQGTHSIITIKAKDLVLRERIVVG